MRFQFKHERPSASVAARRFRTATYLQKSHLYRAQFLAFSRVEFMMSEKVTPENKTVGRAGRLRTLLENILTSAVSVLVVFVVLEAGMRIWLAYLAPERAFLKYASLRQLEKRYKFTYRKWTPHRYLGYYPTPNYVKGPNKHNSLGYRGDEIDMPKPAGRTRIVCLGGSTTYTTELDDYRLSYPYLLEQELKRRGYKNVDVVNSGAGAWTSLESLVNFELRVLELDPDIIIVYHGVNDILGRFVWPHEAYTSDNSGAAAPVLMFMPSILEYSSLLRYVMIRTGMVKPHSSIDRYLAKPAPTFRFFDFYNQRARGTYPQGIFKDVSAEEMLAANTPKYFERNLGNLVVMAKYHGVKTVLATFAYSPYFPDKPTSSSPEFRSAYSEMNESLKSVARRTGAYLFDFAAEFPTDKHLYTDGVHVNAHGSRLKARLFADYLVNSGLLGRAEEN